MSTNSITIKPNNHRIFQCPTDKKIELLNDIIAQDKKLDILVVTAGDASTIKEQLDNKDIRVIEDKDLVKDKELTCQYLISFDLPIKAIGNSAFVKENDTITIKKTKSSNSFELPQKLNFKDFSKEIEPLYILNAV